MEVYYSRLAEELYSVKRMNLIVIQNSKSEM
jgi:hypothetical protein